MELSPTLRSPAEQRRLARYQEVLALASRGLGPKALAQRVGLTRQTVARWLRAGSVPAQPPSRPRRMRSTPYAPYLRERWHAGAQHSRALWRAIPAKGFTGGSETVRRLTVQWHPARGRSGPPKRQSGKPTPRPAPPNCGDTPARTATSSVAPAESGTCVEAGAATVSGALRTALPRGDCSATAYPRVAPTAAETRTGVTGAVALHGADKRPAGTGGVRPRPGTRQGRSDGGAHIQRVQRSDRGAWHVNRLKLIKRTAYGRARFELLRKRVRARV